MSGEPGTPREHYRKAEQLLSECDLHGPDEPMHAGLAQRAHAHAMLALAGMAGDMEDEQVDKEQILKQVGHDLNKLAETIQHVRLAIATVDW